MSISAMHPMSMHSSSKIGDLQATVSREMVRATHQFASLRPQGALRYIAEFPAYVKRQ